MVRFQTQQPGLRLTTQPIDPDDRRETPFKQLAGLYGMWAALSPDTRQWLANLFKSEEAKMLEAPLDTERDVILDTPTSEGGMNEYISDEEAAARDAEAQQQRWLLDPASVEVGTFDPWGVAEQIDTDPVGHKQNTYAKAVARAKAGDKFGKVPELTLTREDIVGPSYYNDAAPNALSTRQATKLMAGGNQSVLDSWPPNDNKTSRTGLLEPTGYWSILL